MAHEKIWRPKADVGLPRPAAGTDFYLGNVAAMESEIRRESATRPLPTSNASADVAPSRKSAVAAVFLAFFFGPLGMLYVRRFWRAFFVNAAGHIVLGGLIVASGESEVTEGIFGGAYVLFSFVFFPVWAWLRVREINETGE